MTTTEIATATAAYEAQIQVVLQANFSGTPAEGVVARRKARELAAVVDRLQTEALTAACPRGTHCINAYHRH